MMKYPGIYTVDGVTRSHATNKIQINGRWVASRPVGLPLIKERIRATWLVFTGKADAIIWPEGQ